VLAVWRLPEPKGAARELSMKMRRHPCGKGKQRYVPATVIDPEATMIREERHTSVEERELKGQPSVTAFQPPITWTRIDKSQSILSCYSQPR
jgi:hypothetical protein